MIPQQDPAQIAAGLRLRLQEIIDEEPLAAVILVESGADSAILGQFFADSTHVIPALGKGNVLAVRDLLADDPLASRLVYLVDCDNSTPPELLGEYDVVVSVNYDLEADLIWHLQTVEVFATTALATEFTRVGDARAFAQQLAHEAGRTATILGEVVASARELHLPVKVRDANNGRLRRVRIHDLPSFSSWVAGTVAEADIFRELAEHLDWTADQQEHLKHHMLMRAAKLCSKHRTAGCSACARRSYASGHEQFSWILESLKKRGGGTWQPRALDSALRSTADQSLARSWPVYTRLRRWQDVTGFALLR